VEDDPVPQYNAANNALIIKAGAKQTESSDPMREAGEPSTVGVVTVLRRCAHHPGGRHGRTAGNLAQHTTRQSEGRTKEAPQRGQEHYKGRSPVGHRHKG
jgi:hypothetical protein